MAHSKPLAIELFAGLFGWGEGLIAEGYETVGFDIVNMFEEIGVKRRPEFNLVLQDVMTLHGKQFKDATLIVASPPCQEYSYMAMPWSRAKAIAAEYRSGVRDVKKLTALFDACFRIQREACEAAGHHIPLIVENVRGAQKWVGRSRWNFGSFHLWGDVPALMPMTKAIKVPGFRFDGSGKSFQSESVKVAGLNWSNHGKPGYKAEAFNTTAQQRQTGTKNTGGSWFNVAHNTTSGKGQNPDGRKAPPGTQWFNDGPRTPDSLASSGSKSSARKAASAAIAKIPLALSRYIAQVFA